MEPGFGPGLPVDPIGLQATVGKETSMRGMLRWGWCEAAAALTLFVAGCSTTTPTEMTTEWKDPHYAAGPMKSMVVFGGRMNATDRRTLENALASALSQAGVHATPSYNMFPGDLPAKEDAQTALQNGGFDAALVATMTKIEERTTGGYSGSFWGGYYGPGWGGGWDPGYVIPDKLVKFETSLWRLSDQGSIVWSATTETQNPSSRKDFAESLTHSVVPALAEAGFLPGTQEGTPVSLRPRQSGE